nr:MULTISPECIES: hypothetical protein [unclassified Mesorhizobium]
MDHVFYEIVDGPDAGFPTACSVADAATLAYPPILANDPAETLEFSGHLIVQIHDLVEGFCDLGIEAFVDVVDAD